MKLVSSVFSLRAAVLVLLSVFWIAMLGIAAALNGGTGHIQEQSAFIAVGSAFLGVALAICSIAFVEPIRSIAIAPERKHMYAKAPMVFIGVSFLLIAVLILLPQLV